MPGAVCLAACRCHLTSSLVSRYRLMETSQSMTEPGITATTFDCILMMRETPQGLTGSCIYKTALFEAATIKRLLRDFQGTRTSGGAARAAAFNLRPGREAPECLLTGQPLSHTVTKCPYIRCDLRRLAHFLVEEHDYGPIFSALNGRGTGCGATRKTASGFLP